MSAESNKLSLEIRLEREDGLEGEGGISAFGAFLKCEEQTDKSPVILLNVQACMSPEMEDEDGDTIFQSQEDRIRLIITTLMHEFGHVLENHFHLPVNEDHIEKACMDWEITYMMNRV